MSVKLYRGKRLWLDLRWDWSTWLVGFDVDRYWSHYNGKYAVETNLYAGPLSISIDF